MPKSAKKTEVEVPPKRPAGPFFAYVADIREDIKKEHPDFKQNDIMKEASVKWKELPESDKQPYKDHFMVELSEYQKQMKIYHEHHPEMKKSSSASGTGSKGKVKELVGQEALNEAKKTRTIKKTEQEKEDEKAEKKKKKVTSKEKV